MAVTVHRSPLRVVKNVLFPEGGLEIDTQLNNKASETVTIGSPVQMDGTPELIAIPDANLVNVGGNDDQIDVSDIVASLATKIHGFAMKAFPSSGQALQTVAVWVHGLIVESNLHEGDNGASPGTHVAALTDLYSEVSMVKGDDGYWYFTTSASERVGQVILFPGIAGNATSGGGLGDTNARVHVMLWDNLGRQQHVGA